MRPWGRFLPGGLRRSESGHHARMQRRLHPAYSGVVSRDMDTMHARLVVVPAALLDDLLEVSSEAARRLRHIDTSDAAVADAVAGSVASVRASLLLEP